MSNLNSPHAPTRQLEEEISTNSGRFGGDFTEAEIATYSSISVATRFQMSGDWVIRARTWSLRHRMKTEVPAEVSLL